MSMKGRLLFRVIENHPNDSRVKFREDDTFQTLSGRMGTGGGNVPMVLEEWEDTKYARTQNPVLCLLSKTYGTQKVEEWGIAIMAALQQTEILQQRVHESRIQRKAEKGCKLDDSTLPRAELVAEWIMRDMRKHSQYRCSPQRRESAKQLNREFTEIMSKLPQQSAPASKALFDMWRQGKRIWVLQQTLHQIQEIWQSSNDKWEGGDLMDSVGTVVRRLTPL